MMHTHALTYSLEKFSITNLKLAMRKNQRSHVGKILHRHLSSVLTRDPQGVRWQPYTLCHCAIPFTHKPFTVLIPAY